MPNTVNGETDEQAPSGLSRLWRECHLLQVEREGESL